MGGTHFLQTGYLLLNRNSPLLNIILVYIADARHPSYQLSFDRPYRKSGDKISLEKRIYTGNRYYFKYCDRHTD